MNCVRSSYIGEYINCLLTICQFMLGVGARSKYMSYDLVTSE